jgi:hypothetical protein
MTTLVITFPGTVDLVDMNAAVNATWQAIRARHRGKIPSALVTIVPGAGVDGGLIDWSTPVIQLAAETVSDGPETVLEALLHQAAHGWLLSAHNGRGATPGRFHSAEYRDLATALQLAPEYVNRGVGWSKTPLRAEAVQTYGDQIAALAAASPDWVPPARTGSERGEREMRNGIVATCACPDGLKIRIRGIDAAEKLAAHPIRCDACGQLYQPAAS